MDSVGARPGQTPALLGIQYLRGVAALMVAYLHLIGLVPALAPFLSVHRGLDTTRLKSGVDIFFVISGFIMLITTRQSRPVEFALRRVIRIVPLYWLLTALLAGLALLHPAWFRTTVVGWGYLLKSLFFIPYPNPGHDGAFAPLLVPGWSLNFEMFFYAIFCMTLVAPFSSRVLINGTTFLLLVGVGTLLPEGQVNGVLRWYANPQIFEFFGGMLMGQAYLSGHLPLSKPVCILLIAGGSVALVGNYDWLPEPVRRIGDSEWSFILASTAIVLGVVAVDRQRALRYFAPGAALGDASYSIYLTHIFSLGVMREWWIRFEPRTAGPGAAALFALGSMFLIVSIGLVVHRFVEKLLLKWLQPLARRTPRVFEPRGQEIAFTIISDRDDTRMTDPAPR